MCRDVKTWEERGCFFNKLSLYKTFFRCSSPPSQSLHYSFHPPRKKDTDVLLLRQRMNVWGIGLSLCTYVFLCVYKHMHVEVYNFQLRGTRCSFIFYSTASCSGSPIPITIKRMTSFGIKGGRLLSSLKQ